MGKEEIKTYLCEINARVTGATYPSVLAKHFLPDGAWTHRNLRLTEPVTGEQLLEMLDRPGHLFEPGKSSGVLPVNFNFGTDELIHKGQFLCLAKTPQQCHDYLAQAEMDMQVQWTFDRD